jgi:hypothetical protein
MVFLFLFLVVIGPDFLFPAMGLLRPSRTPADPAIRLATLRHPANYISDLAGLLLSASFILVTVGLHARLHATAPILGRLALISAVIGGVVGMVGMMVISYTRSAVGAIEDPVIALAALNTTRAVGIGIALVGFMFAGGAFLLGGWAALEGGGVPPTLGWLLVAEGVIFVLYSLIAPLSPGFGGFAGLLLGVAAPLVTLVGMIWLGIVLWRG